VVLGSRVAPGSDIHRKVARHSGRFAPSPRCCSKTRVYDTQCGAKLLRRSPHCWPPSREPFLSRWAFDVELLGRLLTGAPSVPPTPEEPCSESLGVWHDVPLEAATAAMAGALKDLALIGADLARRRRAVGS
jgi:hypothetical protein